MIGVIAGVIASLIGVIFGYFLASFNTWINNNRLRFHLLKQLRSDLTLPPQKKDLSHAYIISAQRLSVIETILSSGVLAHEKKYFNLLKEILILRGVYLNCNTLTDLSNLHFIFHGQNRPDMLLDWQKMIGEASIQTIRVAQELKLLYPNETWDLPKAKTE